MILVIAAMTLVGTSNTSSEFKSTVSVGLVAIIIGLLISLALTVYFGIVAFRARKLIANAP